MEYTANLFNLNKSRTSLLTDLLVQIGQSSHGNLCQDKPFDTVLTKKTGENKIK